MAKIMKMKAAISIILAQAFILSLLPVDICKPAFAQIKEESLASIKKQQEIITNPDNLIIPKEYGVVKSKFTGNANKLIVQIQDAHCNYEAQSNIVNMLEGMIKSYNLNFIAVEGADGLIDTSWFKAFPDEDIRKEVAIYFMKKGEITGPEYLSITTNYPVKLFGAETRSYYIQNLNAFTTSFPFKDETEKYYLRVKGALNRLKNFIYSEDLKKLDAKSLEYESKRIKFNDYVRFIQEMAEKYKINLREYDDFFKLVSVLVYEKKIDFNSTDKERNALIDELSKSMAKEELTGLVNRSMSFKMGKASSADYYNFLKSLASKKEIDIQKRYPNLYNYIIYNSIYSKIDNEKLFHDIKEIEKAVKEKLFANDDQRVLDKLSRNVDVLIGLVNIKLLNGDYEYYKAHKDEFTYEVFADFMKRKAQQYGLLYDIEAPGEGVAKSIPRLEEFYEIAIKRDKALVDNTLNEMANQKQRIAVLVTGGFHSEGMSRILEKQGVSYVVVCPAITKDVPTPYLKILTNQRTSFEDILVDTMAVKEGMLQAPIMSEWVTVYDTEQAKAGLEGSIPGNELTELLAAIMERAQNLRTGWDMARISLKLEKYLRGIKPSEYSRSAATMKEAYREAVKELKRDDALETKRLSSGDENAVLDDGEIAAISAYVDEITVTPEFNKAFEDVHARLAGRADAGVIQAADMSEHTPLQIQACSDAGEKVRAMAETRARETGGFETECHIIFMESSIPAAQRSSTNNLRMTCRRYYERAGYTVHIVSGLNEAIDLLRANGAWTAGNTIMGLVDDGELKKLEAALKAEGLDKRSKLLAMARPELGDNQYIPVKGFYDLMAAVVRINRPLDRNVPADAAILNGVRDLLTNMGVDRPDLLVDALTASDFFIDPVKAAGMFIIRLLPRARAFEGRELRSRYEAALQAVQSL
ncbi:MAG: hypothetical protein PHT32_04650 [Candidatus Omnitrophica bacterium]|nr:hypothetical protein [Candidatus Omnitrophota bacterium]